MEDEFDYETNENTELNSYTDDDREPGFFSKNIWYIAGFLVLMLLSYFGYRYFFAGGKSKSKGKKTKAIYEEEEEEEEEDDDEEEDEEDEEEDMAVINRERIIERLERRLRETQE